MINTAMCRLISVPQRSTLKMEPTELFQTEWKRVGIDSDMRAFNLVNYLYKKQNDLCFCIPIATKFSSRAP